MQIWSSKFPKISRNHSFFAFVPKLNPHFQNFMFDFFSNKCSKNDTFQLIVSKIPFIIYLYFGQQFSTQKVPLISQYFQKTRPQNNFELKISKNFFIPSFYTYFLNSFTFQLISRNIFYRLRKVFMCWTQFFDVKAPLISKYFQKTHTSLNITNLELQKFPKK